MICCIPRQIKSAQSTHTICPVKIYKKYKKSVLGDGSLIGAIPHALPTNLRNGSSPLLQHIPSSPNFLLQFLIPHLQFGKNLFTHFEDLLVGGWGGWEGFYF